MSTTGDSRTSTTPLHYVTDNTWHASMEGRSGFEAVCGARVLPLWGAYDTALASRPKCSECADSMREQDSSDALEPPANLLAPMAAGIASHVTWTWLPDVDGDRAHWAHLGMPDEPEPSAGSLVAPCGAKCTGRFGTATTELLLCAQCLESVQLRVDVRSARIAPYRRDDSGA